MLKLAGLPATTTRQEVIFLRGGLDLLTPSMSLPAGACRRALNFECSTTGGYSRIKGYTRFDGHTSPESATFSTLMLNVTGSIAVGDTITGATSAATGKLIHIDGSMVVYTRATGTFVLGETLTVAAVAQATITGLSAAFTGDSFLVEMLALAANEYRQSILAVPGSGPIRGVVYFITPDGAAKAYAFRDNVGATALGLYKSTTAGWVNVPMARTVSFTTGSALYEDGDTLVQGGVSAPIRRVVLQSGSWGAGDAAGRFIIGTPSGGSFAAGASAGGGVAALTGADAAITLLPGGSFEFDIGAVGAAQRVYAVDGINPAIEFDGTYVVPILTGNAVDVPSRVMVHSSHLFLSFGNSVQHSGIGTAYAWTSVSGAGELRADGSVTVMQRGKGNQDSQTAMISHEHGTQILYGSSEIDFRLVTFEDSAGAKAKSMQLMDQIYALDDRGVVAMAAAQEFGNFSTASLTLGILPFIQARRNLVTGSLVNREKSQFRIFFSDGSGLYITIANGKLLGAMPVQFADPVVCCHYGEAPSGYERAYFGGADGWVYKLDAGTSFDGDPIPFDFTLNFANQRMPGVNKRYRKATVEVSGDGYRALRVGAEFGYGTTSREQWYATPELPVYLSPGYWDELTWDTFIWDGRNLMPVAADINGTGENVGFTISGESDAYDAFTINSITVNYTPRRIIR